MENTYDISQILLPNGDICKIKNTTGNAATATAFSANKTVELTGDVTGSASSTGGWSIATTIGSGKVTNNMLAGSIANGKLSNSYIKINNKTINLGDTVSLADLGLSNVLNFAGTTTTAMSDNLTTATVIINGNSYTPNSGDVVIYSDAEYLWTGSQWELLGNESSYALDSDVIKKSFMNAKGDLITASGDDTPTILTIGSAGQVLTVDSGAPAWKTLPFASTSGAGIVQLSSSTNGSSETKAATEKAVKTVYDAAILKSVGTTKGDIIYWTDNATVARLGRGSDGTFLKIVSNLPSWTTLAATDIPNLSATKITSDTFDAARIPNLNASKITAGTFDVARIPNLSTSKITSGTFEIARGGTGLNTITANQILIGGSNDDTITQIGVTNPGNTDTFTSYISAVPNTPSDNLIVNLKTLKLAIPPMNKSNPIDTTSSSYELAYYAPTSKGKIHSVLIAQGTDDNNTGTAPLWLDPSALAGENNNGHGGALFYGRDMSSAATTKPFKTQWGTLPVEQGGTGVTNFTNNIDKVLITAIDNGIQYFSTITKTSASEANTLVLRNSNGNFAANIITLSSGINTPKPGGFNNVITIENAIPTHYGNLEADNLTATIGTIEMSKISSNVPSDLPIINWYKSILDTKTKIGSIYWTIDTNNNGQASFTNISSEGKIETYQLPAATSTTDTTYKILTTKNTLNGALYVSTDGADPSWGTLPITQGGTGVTTLSDLFNEIKGTGSDGFGDATWVNVTGDTITGQLILNKTTALTSGATSDGALVIGTATNVHLAFDTDSIMAKNNTAVSTLFINEFGGNVNILKASDANYSVNIRSTKTSTSYSTGALVVSGGLGIGGAIYGGSSIYAPSGSFYAGTTSVNNEKIIKVSTNSGEMYMYSTGNTDGNGTRGIYLQAHGTGAAKNVFTVDTNNSINFYGNLTGNVTGNLTGNASTASLLKPIADTTTASASNWNIPAGGKQVWGERFSDTTLKYTNSNDEQVTVTDTGDWTIWLTPSANSNTATLSMSIDGTYYGSFNGNITGNLYPPINGGIYWDSYVESSSDNSDATSIYQIAIGVAGGTELRISQQNDSTDVINLCAPYYIYLNSKKAFTIYDSWLRINEDSGFSSGIYTGNSLLRTDAQLQVGNNGTNFYANSSGNGYFSNTLGIAGTNTGYKLYVNGSSYFNGQINSNNNIVFTATDTTGTSYGISWSGSTDSATIDYYVPSSDLGYLRLNVQDDPNARISFQNRSSEKAYVDGNGFRPVSVASSWLAGQETGAINITDATDTGSYWPWIRQTNTSSAKWFSIGTLNNSLYIIGSTTSRIENGCDYSWCFDLSNGYLYGNFSGFLSGTASNADTVDNEHANAFLHVTGGTSSGYIYAPAFWANQSSGENQVGVSYSGGLLYFWGNSSNGTAGIYDSNGGYVLQRDTSTNRYFGTFSKVTVNGPANDCNAAVRVIDTRTDGGWHYLFDGNCANLPDGSNMYIHIGKQMSTGYGGGLRYYYAGAGSNSNLLGFEFWGQGTKLWVTADGNGGVSGSWSTKGYVNTNYGISTTNIITQSEVYGQSGLYTNGNVNMLYNGAWYNVLTNYGNGNVSVDAASGSLYYGYNNTSCHCFHLGSNTQIGILNANGLYLTGSNGWIRTYSSCGWYSETYGGGIHMTDSTWVRVYNGKSFLVPGNLQVNTAITASSYIYSASYLQAANTIYMNVGPLNVMYNNTWYPIIQNHGNGNTSFNAASGGIYYGYSNTSAHYFYLNSTNKIGQLDSNGLRIEKGKIELVVNGHTVSIEANKVNCGIRVDGKWLCFQANGDGSNHFPG